MNDCILIDNILIPKNKFIGLLPNDIFKFIKLLEIERTICSNNQDYTEYISSILKNFTDYIKKKYTYHSLKRAKKTFEDELCKEKKRIQENCFRKNCYDCKCPYLFRVRANHYNYTECELCSKEHRKPSYYKKKKDKYRALYLASNETDINILNALPVDIAKNIIQYI